MKECKQCGIQFVPNHNTTKYCSDDCRKVQSAARNRAWRATDKGKECERAYRKAGKREAYMKAYVQTDKYKALVKGAYRVSRAKYEKTEAGIASKKLYQQRYRAKDGYKERAVAYQAGYGSTPTGIAARHRHTERRKAEFLAAYIEDVDRSVVMKRDKWMCGICGNPVDIDVAWPDLLSPSMDHIIPLSKGGDHSYKNVQCAHLGCNMSKGNQV